MLRPGNDGPGLNVNKHFCVGDGEPYQTGFRVVLKWTKTAHAVEKLMHILQYEDASFLV